MSDGFEIDGPLSPSGFGRRVRLRQPLSQAIPQGLASALGDGNGVMVIPGLDEIAARPDLLVALSRTFGREVEDYRFTLTDLTSVHPAVPEILLISNMAPVNKQPPKRPEPALTPDGAFPVQYPQRKGWHSDQSYRRPPPDISLFYAVTPVAKDRGQTLFADGTSAYAALPPALKAKVEAAAKTCGVELPFPKMRAFWDGLTDTQRQCLKSADVSRPWGPMSKEQRQQVRKDLEAAAQKCGVTLPTKPANPTPAPSATTSPSALLT